MGSLREIEYSIQFHTHSTMTLEQPEFAFMEGVGSELLMGARSLALISLKALGCRASFHPWET